MLLHAMYVLVGRPSIICRISFPNSSRTGKVNRTQSYKIYVSHKHTHSHTRAQMHFSQNENHPMAEVWERGDKGETSSSAAVLVDPVGETSLNTVPCCDTGEDGGLSTTTNGVTSPPPRPSITAVVLVLLKVRGLPNLTAARPPTSFLLLPPPPPPLLLLPLPSSGRYITAESSVGGALVVVLSSGACISWTTAPTKPMSPAQSSLA